MYWAISILVLNDAACVVHRCASGQTAYSVAPGVLQTMKHGKPSRQLRCVPKLLTGCICWGVDWGQHDKGDTAIPVSYRGPIGYSIFAPFGEHRI